VEITEILKALLSEMRSISSSETVIGEPIRVGEATIVPVNRLGLGFGLGLGDMKSTGKSNREGSVGTRGLGGGVSIHPQAFIVVDEEGRAQILNLDPAKESALAKAIELIPAIADRMMERGERMIGRSDNAADKDDSEAPEGN